MQNFKIEGRLPANHECEIKVLSSILTIPDAALTGLNLLTVDSFDMLAHKHIFMALKDLNKKNIPSDIETFISELQKQPLLLQECGGQKYLLSLAFLGTSNYDHYIGELLNLQQLRQTSLLLQHSLAKASDETTPPFDLLDELNKNILNILTPKESQIETIQSILQNVCGNMTFQEYLEWKKSQGLKGISSGYKKLDSALGGFQDGKLYYCGARTSMGKTTFMLNLIDNIINPLQEFIPNVGLFSLEMTSENIFFRLACIRANINFKKYEMNQLLPPEEAILTNFVEYFKKQNNSFLLDAPSGITIEKLCMKARRLKEFYEIDILFIDYLSRIRAEKKFSSKHLEIDYISKSLQDLARELNIPIFALAQLNRESAKKEDPTPSLTDFRESGSIEEDADACLLLHRPDYYNPNEEKGIVQIKIAKNRLLGTVGTVDLYCRQDKSDRYTEKEITYQAVTNRQYKDD